MSRPKRKMVDHNKNVTDIMKEGPYLPALVPVHIDRKTVIFVAPEKAAGAKERFLSKHNQIPEKPYKGGRPKK